MIRALIKSESSRGGGGIWCEPAMEVQFLRCGGKEERWNRVLANEQYDEKKYDFPHNQNTLQAFYWYFVSNTSFEWCAENYREHLIVFYENGQLFCRHDVLCRGRITKSSWSKQKGLQSKCHKQCNFRIIWKFPPFRNVYRDPPLKLSFVMVMTHLFDCCQCHYYIFYSIKNW